MFWSLWLVVIVGLHVVCGKMEVAWEYIGNCKEKSNDDRTIYLKDASWGMVAQGAVEFNVTIVYEKNFQHIKAIVETSLCQGIDGSGCEKLLTIPFPDLCILINQKGQVWTTFVESIKPPVSCPIKKGTYRADRVVMDMETVQKFFGNLKFPGSFKVVARLSSDNKNVGCVSSVSRILQMNSRKRTSTKKKNPRS